jgi:hypothetical protein
MSSRGDGNKCWVIIVKTICILEFWNLKSLNIALSQMKFKLQNYEHAVITMKISLKGQEMKKRWQVFRDDQQMLNMTHILELFKNPKTCWLPQSK